MKILLFEDDAADARLIGDMLKGDVQERLELSIVERVSSGIALLEAAQFDLILLDLSLPDSSGIETLHRVVSAVRDVPIVVLTGLDDEEVGAAAVREGAQDYLIKGQFEHQLLIRAIRYARERHRLISALQSVALVDMLTGLHNRRGFITIAQEQLKLARCRGDGVMVMFVDLDDMKAINDSFGHHAGDAALEATAGILRSTFRRSDVLARMGGDEFAVFAVGGDETTAANLLHRLQNNVDRHNERAGGRLSLSAGFAHYDLSTSHVAEIEDLLAEADRSMYAAKLRHRARRFARHPEVAEKRDDEYRKKIS